MYGQDGVVVVVFSGEEGVDLIFIELLHQLLQFILELSLGSWILFGYQLPVDRDVFQPLVQLFADLYRSLVLVDFIIDALRLLRIIPQIGLCKLLLELFQVFICASEVKDTP
jgi:hypothetical protein